MKILIYNNNSPYISSKRVGGGETSLKLLAEKLTGLGHDVVYLTKGDKNAFWLGKKKINNVNVIFIPSVRNCKYLFLTTRIVKKIDNFFFRHFFKRVLKRKKTDIVYAFYNLSALEFLVNNKYHSRKPIIVMRMAGLLWSINIKKKPHEKERYKFVFNNVDSINFISEGIKNLSYKHAKQHDIDLDIKNYFIGDIGVEPNKLKNLWKGKVQSAKLNVVIATRFSTYQKRQDIIVEAIKKIDTKGLINVTLIGTGPNRIKIQEKIDEYGLSDDIKVIPFLDQNDLWTFMQNSDLLCHPCDFEGLSKIIIESMMMGLPVLASNVTPLNDYITDGVNGYLSDNDPDAWAEKLIQIYNNKEDLCKISKNQVSFAIEYYNADNNVIMYENEFYRLLSRVCQ